MAAFSSRQPPQALGKTTAKPAVCRHSQYPRTGAAQVTSPPVCHSDCSLSAIEFDSFSREARALAFVASTAAAPAGGAGKDAAEEEEGNIF